MTHFGARKTKAKREAINERARAWPRPLSGKQLAALIEMTRRPLVYGNAGFHNDANTQGKFRYFASGTVTALARKKLCVITGSGPQRAARITSKGRRLVARGGRAP